MSNTPPTPIEQSQADYDHFYAHPMLTMESAALLANATALNRQTALRAEAWEKPPVTVPIHPDLDELSQELLTTRTYLARLCSLVDHNSSALTAEVRDLLFEIKTNL